LSSARLTDENSLADPKKVYPKETSMKIDSPQFRHAFAPYSLTVLRLPVQ
jgi:alpha-L-arabinofuranosidase